MGAADHFAKRYEPKTIEPKWQQTWYQQGAYRFDESSLNPLFSVDTPPPTVSGRLHMGHVFSYTHTEIICRHRRMKGFNVYYPFGYDDNGLPTELLTEKEHKIRAFQMERSAFRNLCLTTAQQYSKLFSVLWKSLGFSCDFDSAYSTISSESQKISQWSFVDLYHKGKVERRQEPALWCVKCMTSFAQAEIEDTFQAGYLLHIPFKVGGLPPLIIATTRPELLAACVAMFVHPEDDRYKAYIGREAFVPLFDHSVPILPDEQAKMEKGTGAVMCCTFGDTTDIHWWRKHKLPLREAISKEGKMTPLTGPLSGLFISQAKEKIEQLLKDQGFLQKKIEIPTQQRVVNTHERCGTAVEFLIQPQWFIKVCDEKQKLLEMGRKVKWHPEYMRARFENWVENLSWDWTISRQRRYGVPIPVWYSENGKQVHVAEIKQLPVDPLESTPPISCPGGGKWIPDSDVLDTWTTSSMTPFINARFQLDQERKNFLPMSMRPQAHDIIRTWAFYTIVKSLYHHNQIPWKDIVISGHVKKPEIQITANQMAGQDFVKKTKISKSKDGDTYSPEKIMERHSADAIRLWSAGASLGIDILFDENGIEESNKFLNKLWNASRFAVMQLENFIPLASIKIMNGEDHWIRAGIKEMIEVYENSFEAYEIHKAKIELDKFFWISFCDNYIEYVKCRCQNGSLEEQQSAKQTLYETLLLLLKLYAPYAPHITEEIYHVYFKAFEKSESIHELKIPPPTSLTAEEKEGLKLGEYLVQVVTAIRQYKSQRQIAFKTPAEKLCIQSTAEGVKYLQQVERVLQNFSSTKKIEIISLSPNTIETKVILEYAS